MSEQNLISPEMSLIETIGKSNLSDLALDTTEALLDQLLQGGLLRDIPFVGSLVNLTKAGVDISNYLFLRKTARFLYYLKDVPEEERRRFIVQLGVDEKFKKRVGENLFLLLHRLDDMQKPELLGRVFKAYMEGKIDNLTFQKLSAAVDRIRIYNVPYLLEFYSKPPDPKEEDDEALQDLAFCGLVTAPVVEGLVLGRVGYTSNNLGQLFIEIALNNAEKALDKVEQVNKINGHL